MTDRRPLGEVRAGLWARHGPHHHRRLSFEITPLEWPRSGENSKLDRVQRLVGGSISKSNNIQIKTPTGTIGIRGGIVAVVPDQLTLCVWSPALDATGNSHLGMKALELFVARTGLSVF